MGNMDKVKKIVDATEKLFTRHRYHEVTLDEISRRAGVGKGTIYLYFKNKEELYYQTVLSGLDSLIESLERCASSGCKDSGEALLKLSEMVHRFFSARRGLFALLRSEELRGSDGRERFHYKWQQKRKTITEIFAAGIRLGIEEGRYRNHLDPAITAALFLGMLSFGFRLGQGFEKVRNPARLAMEIFEKGVRRQV